MPNHLMVGTSEVDITPPVGTMMCGSLYPRGAQGVLDPLLIKAIVFESQGVRLAYVVFDVAMVSRALGDLCVAAASQKTGMPPSHIIWSCTHTHSGPYTDDWFPYDDSVDPTNRAWLASLPEKFALAVASADAAKVPVRHERLRAYHSGVSHNRRLRYKDGREINTWLLNGEEEKLGCVGAAGPIDPEIGILAFDDETDRLRAVLFNFALHANARGGVEFSGDYPAIVAARLREAFGPQVVTLYMPGACGDINPIVPVRQVGDALTSAIIERLQNRRPVDGPLPLAARQRQVTVPIRDWRVDQEERIKATQWPDDCKELFRQNLEIIRRRGATECQSLVHAWRIGDTGMVGLPGELFVQWGLHIKQQSPFPWTFPVELCGDYLGYLVTPQAWEAGGYESLISTVALPSVEGVEKLVAASLEMLGELARETVKR